jgi:uncharacterized RDD family membrane protein YckC
MILDHFIMTFGIVIAFLSIAGIGYLISNYIYDIESTNVYFILMFILGFVMFSIYFNKDAIKGRSPGKRILGYVIIENETGNIAKPLRTFVRNLTMMIWPLEVLFSIFSPNRRIGDYLAGTKVIPYNKELESKTDITQLMISLTLGVLFIFLIVIIQALITSKGLFEW